MLPYPPGHEPYRIVSIDPGTDTLGTAVIDIDLEHRQVGVAEVYLFKGSQLQRHFPQVAQIHGDRMARLMGHEENLLGFFQYARPHCVISEAPYYGRLATPFAALTECVSAIRRAVYRYDPLMPLYLIDPASVKKNVGVSGKSNDKTLMTQALLRLKELGNPSGIPIADLDEHSVDAIAVGVYQAGIILKALA